MWCRTSFLSAREDARLTKKKRSNLRKMESKTRESTMLRIMTSMSLLIHEGRVRIAGLIPTSSL